jgi:hypothetical protein
VPITFEISGTKVRRRFLIMFEESITTEFLIEAFLGEVVMSGRHIISIVGFQVVEFRGECRALMRK